MATHSSIPTWRIPWTEEPGRLQSIGSQEWDMTYHSLSFLPEGLIKQTTYLEWACVPMNVIALCPVTIQPITYNGS